MTQLRDGRKQGTGIRPHFASLAAAYPPKSKPRPELYAELGFGELVDKLEYQNTCGIRMSYALTKAGSPLTKGGLRIQAGPHQGKRIEPSMRKLANHLAELWGVPEKYASEDAAIKGIGRRKGVVAFFFTEPSLLGGAQGHIDLVWPTPNGFHECAGTCFFSPRNNVWFWPLN